MIYRKLQEIPLHKFVNVCQGDTNSLFIDRIYPCDELEQVSKRLINDYLNITQGLIAQNELEYNNEYKYCSILLQTVDSCRKYINDNDWQEACNLLSEMGYHYDFNDKSQIINTVENISNEITEKRNKLIINHENPSNNIDFSYLNEEIKIMEKWSFTDKIFEEWNADQYAIHVILLCKKIIENKWTDLDYVISSALHRCLYSFRKLD